MGEHSIRTYVINARFAVMRMTGVQRAAYETVSRLVRNKNDYLLVSPRPGGEVPSLLPVERQGLIRQGHLWEQIELPRLLRRVRKNAVLYSPMMSGPVAVSRQVVTIHDLFPVEHPEWFSKAFNAWYSFMMPRLLRKVAFIAASSDYTRQRLLDRYSLSQEKIVLCHLAQDERFSPAPVEQLDCFRAKYGLPERYLLYVGSVEPRKNLKTLVSAWKRTVAREEGVKLVIAGGAAREDVFNAAESGAEVLIDPSIQRLGFFSDEHLPLLYQGAEAFTLPSLAEGFGLPVLEAMACGTPVICSNTTAMPEIAGGAAYLVPPLEIEAWTEAIDLVLSDPEARQRMSRDGLRRASDFSWSRTADIVRSMLESV